jgi:hypothetical protein
MTEEVQGRQQKRKRLWWALVVLVAILAVLIVPPLVSLNHYKGQITHLMAASLGRPVHLSAVELRLLPRPGFLLSDLTVEEDPAYGAEPILHANSVTASIRLLSLWRGRLEISRVSVDEASLNLVRSTGGRWNLDSLLRSPAVQARDSQSLKTLPYLVATHSRINIKNGVEKLPFSLIDAEFSFSQENPGDLRIKLRGQPARTDLSLDLADTGEVRMEVRARRAPLLRQMPVHLDLEWREAQLGQLTRLIIGSDPGWRGNLTGELHLDGTAEAAQVKARLRATGVHRAEFAPATPLDFDAKCNFVYRYSARAVQNLACDSPIGDGRIHFAGDLPGEGGLPHFSVEMDRIPVAVGLDTLRAIRSNFGPGLEAKGAISGKIDYAGIAPENNLAENQPASVKLGRTGAQKPRPSVTGPLTGSFTIQGFQLSGGGLSTPIQIPKLVLEPVAVSPGPQFTQTSALIATFTVPAGGVTPLTMTSRLALSGYQLTVRGQASIARARELAHVAGMADAAVLDSLAGDAASVDLSAEGPWLPGQKITLPVRTASVVPVAVGEAVGDRIDGTVILHNANWKAGYLNNPVEIAQATLHLGSSETRLDPVVFSYGPVKGTASLVLPKDCAASQPCQPSFQVQFGTLDSSALQAAILGAHKSGTLLATLLARLRPTSVPAWPQMEGTVKADSFVLGPVTLHEAMATVRILQTGAEITQLDANLLGGHVHGTGALHTPATTQDKPEYTFKGQLQKLSPSAVGQFFGLRWSGGTFDANGEIDLSGYSKKDLADSAKGTLHFEWQHGTAVFGTGAQASPISARFDRWTADTEIANGSATLKQNQVQRGARKSGVQARVTLGPPLKTAFDVPQEVSAKR